MWRTFPVRRTADERIFLAVFFLYIKKYATWCPLSQRNDCANLDRSIDVQRLSCFFNLFFLEPPKPNQRRRDRLLPPPTVGCAATHASWPHHTLKLCASSPAPVRSRPRPHHRPPPWFARRGAALWCCQHGQQPRGIRR